MVNNSTDRKKIFIYKFLILALPVIASAILISFHFLISAKISDEERQEAEAAFGCVHIHDVSIISGQEISASDFVETEAENRGLCVSFDNVPDNEKTGKQEVNLILTYGRLNEKMTAELTVSRRPDSVAVDVGSKDNVTVWDYLEDRNLNAEFHDFDPNSIDRSEIGRYKGQIKVNGSLYDIILEVADLTPPTADPAEGRTVYIDHAPDPESLVENISDYSEVTVTFAGTPDFSKEGEVSVSVLLTDAFGNKSSVDVTVTVIKDTEPPVFSGIRDRTISVGDTLSYKKGVTVTDNSGEDITFTVDSSNANRNIPGKYTVVYTARDSAGNTATVNMTLTVVKISVSDVEAKIEKIVSKITNDSMTLDEKIKAVWNYTRKAIHYTRKSTKSDIYTAANEGMNTHGGDCYTYYAMNTLLFNCLGIENAEVRRSEGNSRHWWSLVRFEDGKWYFVDSCPLPVAIGKYSCKTGKMTKSYISYLTRLENKISGSTGVFSGYYVYDEETFAGYDIAE